MSDVYSGGTTMKRFLRMMVVGVLFATGTPSFVFAQAGTPTEGTAKQNISGKWSGTFDITGPDGSVQHTTAFLILKQDGDVITGSAGPGEDQQKEIQEGKLNGAGIDFFMMGQTRMVFHLRVEGDHIRGDASTETDDGKMTAKLDVTRVTGK
jgi:hypothetical protein